MIENPLVVGTIVPMEIELCFLCQCLWHKALSLCLIASDLLASSSLNIPLPVLSKKSNVYHICSITPKRVTSVEAPPLWFKLLGSTATNKCHNMTSRS